MAINKKLTSSVFHKRDKHQPLSVKWIKENKFKILFVSLFSAVGGVAIAIYRNKKYMESYKIQPSSILQSDIHVPLNLYKAVSSIYLGEEDKLSDLDKEFVEDFKTMRHGFLVENGQLNLSNVKGGRKHMVLQLIAPLNDLAKRSFEGLNISEQRRLHNQLEVLWELFLNPNDTDRRDNITAEEINVPLFVKNKHSCLYLMTLLGHSLFT